MMMYNPGSQLSLELVASAGRSQYTWLLHLTSRDEVACFKTVRLDKELNTICWEGGADFAPEFLYSKLVSKKMSRSAG